MKKQIIILLIALNSLNVFSQSYKTEKEFKDYLVKNIKTIDPIEGIWSGTSTISNKVIVKDVDEVSPPSLSLTSEIRIIIIKENDYYVAYQSDKFFKEIFKPIECFNYKFEKTSISGKYLFSYSCSNKSRSGVAYISDNSTLEFIYKNKTYESSYGGVSIDEGKINLTKISLNSDDIKNALLENPIIPDKVRGTAFAIGDRYIVTAFHLVKGYNKFRIRGINGDFNTSYNCIVNAIDSLNDMAILYISDINFNGINNIPYCIKVTPSRVGEKVFCLGYPLINTMGDEIKLTDGLISSRTGFLGDTLQYQISVPVQPGNSGGPLFDNNGNLVGIIIAKHNEAENATYALKISCLKKIIKKRPAISTMPKINQLSQKDLPNKVILLEKYIYTIESIK